WQVGRLLALEDAINVAGRLPILVQEIGPVRNKAAAGDVEALRIDSRQSMPGRQRDNQIAVSGCQSASRYDQTVIWGTREGRDSALDLAWIAYAEGAQLHPQRWRRCLDGTPQADPGSYGGIANDCRSCRARRDLFQQLQPFCADGIFP